MNISCKPITLCFVFVVLGSTLAFARPMTCAESGCRSYEKKTAAFHAPTPKPCATAAMRVTAYRIRLRMIGQPE
jgi:hypothetical protein